MGDGIAVSIADHISAGGVIREADWGPSGCSHYTGPIAGACGPIGSSTGRVCEVVAGAGIAEHFPTHCAQKISQNLVLAPSKTQDKPKPDVSQRTEDLMRSRWFYF